jgi:cholesterol transport system auxiliary component
MTGRWLLFAVMLALGGCSGITQRRTPESDVYALTSPGRAAQIVQHSDVLLVARPRARAGLDGDQLTVHLADGRQDSYTGARWAAPLPQLIEGPLIDALQAAGVGGAVLSDRSTFHGRYLLQTEIIAFTAEYASAGAAPTVHVELSADLGATGNRQWLATASGSGQAQATADRRTEVVIAYQAAWNAAVQQLAAEVSSAIRQLAKP